jgi:hypothetical protein
VVIKKTIGVVTLVEGWQCNYEENSCKSVAMKGRLYVCCSYGETVIISVLKSVAGIRLVMNENTSA